MLDWKILVSAIVALIVVLFILVGGFGLGGFFSDTMGGIGSWFGSSPFGGLVSGDGTDSKFVTILLYPPNLTLEPDSEVSIYAGTMDLTGFKGSIDMDFENDTIALAESNSKLRVTIPSNSTTITDLMLAQVSLQHTKFMIEPDLTTNNGTINIHGFSGSAMVKIDGLELRGNVSKLSANIGDLDWEMS